MSTEKPEIQNSKSVATRPLIFAMVLASGLFFGMSINKEKKDKFSQIFDIINRDYVDSTRVDLLEENAIDYLLSQLDPHSAYIPAQLSEINDRQIRGNYQGLGIEYIQFSDTLFVYNTSAGGPAEKVGIKAGDRLLKAGKIDLTDSMSSTELQEAIQGDGRSQLSLKIYRRSSNQYLNFMVPRENIVMNSSEVYYMVNQTLGYIRLERFSSNTHAEFLKAMDALKSTGMKDLIIDLRNNGGGLLSEASAIANEFLQKDEVISYTFGFHRNKNYYRADGNGGFKEGKLVLLINHNTASASEILAGALQDNDRAVIIGNRSFGKGLVQEPFRLSDGAMLRLTIARYYTPSGRSIQKAYNKDIEKYRNEIYARDQFKDTLNPILDSSIKKEFFSKNGRFLTSGGGIRPDIILRDTIADSTEIEMLMPGLFYSHIFDIYVLDYMSDILKKESKLLRNEISFQNEFNISQEDVIRLIGLARKIPYLRELKYSAKTADIIRKHLKAALAYRMFGEKGRSRIINREEGVFSKSIEVLKKYSQILNISNQKMRRFDY